MVLNLVQTAVSVSSWCAHHNAANFKDPDTFIPERWLDGEYKSDDKLASRPFSLGPRGCIGKEYVISYSVSDLQRDTDGFCPSLSYLEMRLVLCRLFWSFDISAADDSIEQWNPEGQMKHMKAYSTWQKPGLNVIAKKRLR